MVRLCHLLLCDLGKKLNLSLPGAIARDLVEVRALSAERGIWVIPAAILALAWTPPAWVSLGSRELAPWLNGNEEERPGPCFHSDCDFLLLSPFLIIGFPFLS